MNETKNKQVFWDERAQQHGEQAGTDDFLLKELEMRLLHERVPAGARILDAGCGNGMTLCGLIKAKGGTGVGFDFAEAMLEAARARAQELSLVDQITFYHQGLPELPAGIGEFDCAISERSLMNLDNLADQHTAFCNIMNVLHPGGTYFMIESSLDGLDKINAVRQSLQLEPITVPWHNTFFRDQDVVAWQTANWRLADVVHFASTYYFLSRVVYAKLAQDRGEKLRYDSDINLLSVKLPNLGDYAPARLWVWRKRGK